MEYQLRQPILEILDKGSIKIKTNGSRIAAFSLLLFGVLFSLAAGFAFYRIVGFAAGIAFGLFNGALLLIPIRMYFTTARYYVFNVLEKSVTKYPLLGSLQTFPFDLESLNVSKKTYAFIIKLLHESVKSRDTKKGYLSVIEHIEPYKQAFCDFYKPTLFKRVQEVVLKILLYLFAAALFIFVGLIVFFVFYSVFRA